MARRPQNRNRVRDLREVIEERRVARLLAEAQARAVTVHQARSVARSMLSSGECFVAELHSVRPNTREFIIPMRIPLEDIVRNGLHQPCAIFCSNFQYSVCSTQRPPVTFASLT